MEYLHLSGSDISGLWILSLIGIFNSGSPSSVFRTSSSTKPSSTSTASSSANPSSFLTQSSRTTAVSSSTKTGYDMEIATILTQPVDCATGGLTEIALPVSELWQDAINPVPKSTGTSCYPSQFHSGVLVTASGISLALPSELGCPYDRET